MMPSMIGAVLVGVPAQHAGVASGTLATIKQFSISIGVAALGVCWLATGGRLRTRSSSEQAG